MMKLPDFGEPKRETLLLIGGGQGKTARLEEALRDAGHEVVVAACGSQALSLIAQHPPDMIIVVETSPARSEVFLTSLLHESFPDIPFLRLNEGDETGGCRVVYRSGKARESHGEALLAVSRSLVGVIRAVDSEGVQPKMLNHYA